MKAFALCSLTGLLLVAASCSHKQKSTGAERLKWNMSTLVEDYDRFGQKSPKWDETVHQALTEFAKIRAGSDFEMETRLGLVGDAAKDAVKAGCNDPLVRFLYCRYSLRNSTKSLGEKQSECRRTAEDMEGSGYDSLRKFYANLAAVEILWRRDQTNLWPEVRRFRTAAIANLCQVLEDKKFPVEEACFASSALIQLLDANVHALTNAYFKIEKPLFKNWSGTSAAHLIKAKFYFEWAWRGRGNGTADQVSADQWKMFFDRLKEAEAALNKAWALNADDAEIPALMISVAEGEKKDRAEVERWFQRAMKLDPNSYAACRAKLHYLSPQWHGSREDMLAFGRECVAATNWGGKVPLILVDAHSDYYRLLRGNENRAAYWLAPDVWPDLKAGYERYVQANPEETRFRYPYAAYAFRCGQWQTFIEQVDLLRNGPADFRFDYFGGEETFTNMVASARQQLAGGK